jgi:hypothetical protein
MNRPVVEPDGAIVTEPAQRVLEPVLVVPLRRAGGRLDGIRSSNGKSGAGAIRPPANPS